MKSNEPGHIKMPLIGVKPRFLPPSLGAYLDPKNPLERKRFVPQDLEEMKTVTVLMVLSTIFTISVGFITIREAVKQFSGQPINPEKLYGGLLVTGICLIFSIGMSIKAYKGRRDYKAYEQGQYRRGVYVLEKGVLFFDGRICSWIPRQNVISIDWQMVGAKEYRHAETWIDFKNENREQERYWVPQCIASRHGALQSWMKTGKF